MFPGSCRDFIALPPLLVQCPYDVDSNPGAAFRIGLEIGRCSFFRTGLSSFPKRLATQNHQQNVKRMQHKMITSKEQNALFHVKTRGIARRFRHHAVGLLLLNRGAIGFTWASVRAQTAHDRRGPPIPGPLV